CLGVTVHAALEQHGRDERDSIQLADLMLAAGDAAGARKQYDEVLAKNDASAEALRGAARASAAAGDTAGALGYWRRVVEASAPGGTPRDQAPVGQGTPLPGGGPRGDARPPPPPPPRGPAPPRGRPPAAP